MAGQDVSDRWREVLIEPAVTPYSFFVWRSRRSRRQGGAVTFRGQCRRGRAGDTDVRMIQWWLSEFYEVSGGFDGLVVVLWEFGAWHPRLSFVPPQRSGAGEFRLLIVVLPHEVKAARKLWGKDCVRNDPAGAGDEIEAYLDSLDRKA